jgi:hypothetical protein
MQEQFALGAIVVTIGLTPSMFARVELPSRA